MEQQSKTTTKPEISRRVFIKQVLLGSAGLYLLLPLLQGCGGAEPGGVQECGGLPPYNVWAEMLLALETSPDHLRGRMKSLVKRGDPEAMLRFVRDEFYLLPLEERKIGDLNASKWGVRYVLRSGWATPREKAELLHTMFSQAGISSKVITERTDFTDEEVTTFFLRPIKRTFLPKISDETLQRWAKEMGRSSVPESPENPFDGIAEEANELGEQIWNALDIPGDYRYFNDFNFNWKNYETPVVSFEWEGERRYAHLFDPAVPFGELRSGSPQNVREAKPLEANDEKVSLRITYRDSITPDKEKELISGEWPATYLVGRQLDVQFLNNLSLEEQATTRVRDVRTFTPAIALQAIDESQEYMAERSILADPITLTGQRIHLNEKDGKVKVGNSILTDEADPERLKNVTKIEASAQSAGYPGVKLSITPTDSNDALVEGLQANAFQITEDGRPVRAIMQSNRRTPRILLMVDGSGSMPDAYSGENMARFTDDLKTRVLQQYPAADITYWETDSSLYTWLLKASKTNNDLIIFATDGHVWDEFEPRHESVYVNGPPAIILDVLNGENERGLETFEKMAALTGGRYLPVQDMQAAMQGITSYLEGIEIPPYVFTYNAAGEEGERNVSVRFDEERLTASTTYEAIKPKDGEPPGPQIIGLYLTLDYDGADQTVRRVLAGWEDELDPKKEPTQAMVEAVNDFMFSSVRLSFEGAGATDAAALSDLLKARMSTQKWGEPLLQNDLNGAKEGYSEGYATLSGQTLSLMAPLAEPVTKASMTVPAGLRIGIETVTPSLLSGESVMKFDYLPTSKYITLAADPVAAFKTNIQKTAELAVREQRLFQFSTASLLAGQDWINLAEAKDRRWFDDLSRENGEYLYWRKRVDYGSPFKVFDRTARTRTFWNIDKYTGELYGILPDATGGGQNRFQNEIDGLGKTLDLLMKIVEVLGYIKGANMTGGLPLGIIAKYGVTLTQLYAIASEAILIKDTTGMDEKVKKALQKLACEVYNEIVFDGIDSMSRAGIEELAGLIMGDDSPFSCG